MSTQTVILSDRIEAPMFGRQFGTGQVAESEFEQECPEALRVLVISLKEESRLLELQPQAGTPLEKQAVYDAYRHDLALLTRRVADFEHCVQGAIRCSIISHKKDAPWDEVNNEAEKLRAALKAQIPPIGKRPLLSLDYQLAAQEAPVILVTLQGRFEQGVTYVSRLFTCWLHLLVEHEFVGLIEWTDVDVARYHYFLRERQKVVLKEDKRQEVAYDHSQSEGQRTTYTDTTDRTVRRQDFLERHVHHIVNARVYDLADYPRRVPARVADFLNEVPVWLRPLLQVVAGDITTEEVIRRKTGDSTTVESEVTSVYKGSPAVTIGNFALLGWSSDDLQTDNAQYYYCQQAKRVNLRRNLRTAGWVAAVAVPVVAFAVWAGVGLYRSSETAAAARYNAYVATLDTTSFFTTRAGDSLVLEGQEVPIFFSGIREVSGGIPASLRFSREESTPRGTMAQVRTIPGLTREWGRQYGDIDLGPEFGVFAKLHVVEASPNLIRYKVTYYSTQ